MYTVATVLRRVPRQLDDVLTRLRSAELLAYNEDQRRQISEAITNILTAQEHIKYAEANNG